jgi:hypothetical protein
MAPDADPETLKQAALAEFVMRSRTASRQAGIDAAAVETLDAFAAAGVDALLLKGAALARMLYRAGETRAYFDVDLLVAPANVAAGGRVLADLGYANLRELQGIDDTAGSLHADTWARSIPGFGNVTIDLHWRLEGCDAPPDVAWGVLCERSEFIEVSGSRIATLDRSGLALHLALHAAQHGPGDLKAMGDLQRGVERWPADVWRDAAQLSRRLNATETFAAGLRLLPESAVVAADLGLPTADSILWTIAHRDARPRGTFHVQALSEARGARERAGVLRRALLPQAAWIVWEYRWAAGGRLRLLAAYGLHMLRSPALAARAWRFRRSAQRQRS